MRRLGHVRGADAYASTSVWKEFISQRPNKSSRLQSGWAQSRLIEDWVLQICQGYPHAQTLFFLLRLTTADLADLCIFTRQPWPICRRAVKFAVFFLEPWSTAVSWCVTAISLVRFNEDEKKIPKLAEKDVSALYFPIDRERETLTHTRSKEILRHLCRCRKMTW